MYWFRFRAVMCWLAVWAVMMLYGYIAWQAWVHSQEQEFNFGTFTSTATITSEMRLPNGYKCFSTGVISDTWQICGPGEWVEKRVREEGQKHDLGPYQQYMTGSGDE